jgi:hypothetical protein
MTFEIVEKNRKLFMKFLVCLGSQLVMISPASARF